MIIPRSVPKEIICEWPCSCATGTNSSNVIKTITPAANAKAPGTKPTKFFKNKAAKTAPTGSATPDNNASLMALNLEHPAAHKGTTVAIPSGMLCKAIAIAIKIPNSGICK